MDHRKACGTELVKFIDLVVSLIRAEDVRLTDLGTKIAGAYLEIASTETVWTSFEAETISPICEAFKGLIEHLRKRFCTLYSSQVNRQARRYFRALSQVNAEPVDIHSEFFPICQYLIEANAGLKKFQAD